MATAMRAGDYIARIEFDEEEKLFHGTVVNVADVIEFYGDSVESLEKEFRTSIDTYINACEENKITPSKPFSGRFNVRLDPSVHGNVSAAAVLSGQSLNEWVASTLEREAKKVVEG